MGTTIADFDPLFDDEAFAESLPSLPTMSASASKQAFTLSLPTFEKPPPIAEQAYFGFSSLGDSTPAFAESSDFFDQNVGTIALPGSHSVSEHPLIPIASTSSSTGVTEATDSQPYIETSEGSQSGRPKSSTAVAKKRVKKRSGVRKEKGKVKDVSYSSQSACDAALERLAQDPNVMPLLQAIVEYVYRAKLIPELPQASAATSASDAHLQSASSSHSTSIPSGSHPSPFKRRKLNRIPAGAEDWAIPFPFQQGHEPKQYMQRWDSRKMVLLLQSLLRNLRNWKSQHGLIRVRPQPTARNLRFDKDRPPTRRSNAPKDTSTAEEAPGETDTGVGSLFDPDFLAQIGQIDVGVIDQLLMSLPTDGMLEGISNQSQDTPSSTSLNLPALFGATALDSAWAEADPQRSISPLVLDLMHTSDNQQLDASMAVGQAETGFFNNESLYATGDMTSSSHLGLHFPELFANEKQIPDYQPDVQMDIGPIDPLLIEMDSVISRESTSIPSMTASPSTFVPSELATPTPTVVIQTPTICTLPLAEPQRPPTQVSPPSIGHHSVPAVSKRGKGRSTAALRRDINKQSRRSGEIASAPPTATPSNPPESLLGKEKRKMRASDATVKRREDVLEKAKEWRGMLEQQLKDARRMRWEVMMEGMVLRETAEIVRNGLDLDTRMEDDGDG